MGLHIESAYVGILTCDECGHRVLLDVEQATLSDVLGMGWCVLHDRAAPGAPEVFTCPECVRGETVYVPVESP